MVYCIERLYFGTVPMLVSPTEAVKIYKISKPTLYNDMKSGKLSYELNGRKKRKVNVAELDRLYDKRKDTGEELTSKTVKAKQNLTNSNGSNLHLEREINSIREQVETGHKREVELLNNQIEQLRNQVESLNKNLNKALDVTALLEDKREGQGDKQAKLDAKFKSMETVMEELRTQNKKLLDREEERQRKAEERRKKQRESEAKDAEEREQKKPILKRLFSIG